MASDTIIVRMSTKGQIVIPAAVRRRLGWTAGQIGRDAVEELHERRRRERAAWAWLRSR